MTPCRPCACPTYTKQREILGYQLTGAAAVADGPQGHTGPYRKTRNSLPVISKRFRRPVDKYIIERCFPFGFELATEVGL